MNIKKILSWEKQPTWINIEYFNTRWKKRIYEMSKFIEPSDKSILDLGCGKMWLKEYLKPDIIYYGCDYKLRDKNTLVCDFNKMQFPEIFVDICFASGILEYIEDLDWFFDEIRKNCNTFIVSYCILEYNKNIVTRRRNGWKNHLNSTDLIEKIESKGFLLINSSDKIKGNCILKFEKK